MLSKQQTKVEIYIVNINRTVALKTNMKTEISTIALVVIICLLCLTTSVYTAALADRLEPEELGATSGDSYTLAVIDEPELVIRTLDNLLRELALSASLNNQILSR